MNQDLLGLLQKLESHMCQVVLGKQDVVRMVLVAVLAGEHILLEDVPGVGKTLVAKTLAKSVQGKFSRIQFTPDLLPSDIVGSSVFSSESREFSFAPGPVFSNVVLADEINRTPPRTQSALLEAMSDRQVSVDGQTHSLPSPFIVIATQNPFEFEGTYPLPESQLDRFLLRISMGYPDRNQERQVLASHRDREPVEELNSIIDCQQIVQLQQATRQVRIDDAISDYLLDIVHATRECSDLHVGVSTRGALSLYRGAQAHAMVHGRDYVIPDDIKKLSPLVIAHRVVPKGYLHAGQRTAVENLIRELVDTIAVPE